MNQAFCFSLLVHRWFMPKENVGNQVCISDQNSKSAVNYPNFQLSTREKPKLFSFF